MTQSDYEKFIADLGEHTIDRDTSDGLILYKTPDDKIYAIIHDGISPLRIEARCDQQLADLLREKYESVLPSHNMDRKTWNEIICTGQLPDDDVKDLLVLSYNLTTRTL